MHTSFLSRHFVFIQLLAAALMAHTATRGQSLTVKGTWDPGFPDQAAFVRLVGTNAVIASRWERLKMADVSDPQRPRIVGDVQVTSQTDPYHRIAALAVDGEGHAFLAGTDTHFVGRFYVYDISSPADPKLIGKRDIVPTFPDDNFGMAVSPGRAYLAANAGGLLTFDVSVPTSPQLLSAMAITNIAHDVQYDSGLAYVGAGEGLVIVDVSAPANPSRVGRFGNITITKLALQGHYVYAVGDANGPLFAIFDVSDPYSPKRVFQTNPGVPLRGISLASTNVFISAGTNGVLVYNVSDPTNAVPVTTIPTLGTATDIDLNGNFAFSAELEGGLLIYDLASSSQPKINGQIEYGFAAALPQSFAIANNYAYLVDRFNGIRILDIHDQPKPTEVALYPLRPRVGPVVTDGRKLYVGNGSGFQIMDLANPTNLTVLGAYTFASGSPYSLALSGSRLFTDANGAFDVSDPMNPQPIGAPSPPAALGGVIDVDGSFLYFTSHNRVTQVDIEDISAPVATATATPLAPRDIASQDGFLYAAQLNSFTTFDGRSGSNLIQTSTQFTTSAAQSVAVEGPILVVGSAGIILENASVAEGPVAVATNNIGTVVDVAVQDGVVYAVSFSFAGGPTPFYILHPDLGPIIARPELTVTIQGPYVILHWPASYPGMKLYSTTAPDGTWNLVTSSPPKDAGGYSFTNTIPTNPALFYKLSNQ